MLRSKKIQLLSIALVSIVLCLMERQHIIPLGGQTHQAKVQDAPALLHETAMGGSGAAEAQDSTRLQVHAAYGNLPLSFEPNRGQTDPQVKFLSRAGNRTLWLTGNEAVLAVAQRSAGFKDKRGISERHQLATAVLRMKFLEANASPSIEGEARQPGMVNYFPAKRSDWRTRIPTYARVRYRQLYPGVDLVFYGNNNQLEYDLVVSPGADPQKIKLAVEGAEAIRLDADGNLLMKTSLGDVVQQKPRVYQRNGSRVVKVAGNYVITGENQIGFRLGSYDRRTALVIDPALRYSTFLGGNDFDQARGIGVDSSNRAVVGGITCSLNFPRTVGPTTFQGCSVFITKFDFTGSHLVFSTFIGESAFDVFDVGAMALDSHGNSYATGEVEFFGFPTTPGSFEPNPPGPFTGFVVKLNFDGTHLTYSTFLGGHDGTVDAGHGITADSDGNAYITGMATSSDFPTTPGVFQPDCRKADVFCENAFITKLSPDGSHLIFSTFLGATGTIGEGIALDQSRNVLVTGATGADFPTTAGSAQPVFPGGTASFVTKLSSSGSHLIFSTYLRGNDEGRAVAADASGNAFVASGDFFITGNAGFVTKLSPSVGRLLYSRTLGGAGTGIAVTPGGQAYITGVTSSPTFPTTQTAFQRVIGGTVNAFLTKLHASGQVIYSSFLGGSSTGLPEGMIRNGPVVALDPDTNAYVAGTTQAGYPVNPGAFQGKFGGGESDAFVAKVVGLCALNSANRTVTICAPGNGSKVTSPVRIIAGTTDVTPVKLTQIYLDGKKIFEQPLSAIDVALPIAGGTHRLTVQALDTDSVFFKRSISINVSPH